MSCSAVTECRKNRSCALEAVGPTLSVEAGQPVLVVLVGGHVPWAGWGVVGRVGGRDEVGVRHVGRS